MTAHRPMPRTWTCAACGRPWPCPTRQRQFLAEYDGALATLTLTLGSAMIYAADELRDVPAGRLHDQFIGWLPGWR
ncbi:hypothetical protein ACNTMW_07350 [Planosporangium sp. 12N6]|uniref:hypothetical protein n=1 Tax=Planosporangium spinosum TaxID=3402278 RepID=UPI003CF059FD